MKKYDKNVIPKKTFSEKDINMMIDMYNKGSNLNILARKFETHRGKIKNILVDNKCNIREYTGYHNIDVDYFRIIDSGSKAYFLGFIFADGCVFENKNKSKVTGLSIQIQKRDREIIDNFKKDIKSSHPINILKSDKKEWQDKVGFSLINQEFVRHLCSKGCLPRKSTTCAFPISFLNEEYYSHFIRGYIDGDGCLTSSTRYYAYPQLNVCVSQMFGEQLQDVIEDKFGFRGSLVYKKSGIYSFILQKQRCVDVLHWIYSDAKVYLRRKYDRYLFFKDYYENKRGKIWRKLRSEEWSRIKY